MTFAAKTGAAALLGCLALPAGPAAAQSDDVPLIMLKPQGAGALSSLRLEKLYAAIRKRSDKARGQVLPLTKTEVWVVPKANVEGVRKAAAGASESVCKIASRWRTASSACPAPARSAPGRTGPASSGGSGCIGPNGPVSRRSTTPISRGNSTRSLATAASR